MAKKNTPEVKNDQKIVTKYDRKVEARKQQKIKDARQEKITKTIAAVIGILLAASIIISAGVSIVSKSTALKGTYIKIGDKELTQLEYDYYYNSAVNSYLTTYSSILPYMGLDTSVDFDKQQYTDQLTWKDMFDEMTVEQIKQTKAMADDAAKNGFEYDVEADYESFTANLETAASSAGAGVGTYYKQNFGKYATASNMEPFIKENLLAGAYYEKLLTDNAPSDEEIKAYYEENKQSYDKVDYRSFTFTADIDAEADEDAVAKAMDELKTKAEAMMKARQDGEDFEELCLENASEDAKANYEDADSEYSLSEGRTYAGIPSVMAQWLYEDGRKEGDIAVLADETSSQYYVVEFIEKYYDEADDANISSIIASQRVTEYTASLVENYEVTDVKGNLKYLTAAPAQETEEESPDAGEETPAAEEQEQTSDAEGQE
ncbi:MAG: peptidyl-prolyl cis-trans isomerase [Lachnospiraceae bacterium]|nr:peptidyl-prolyl cis-trans isomerase [Lachnospiraceae bacterium]